LLRWKNDQVNKGELARVATLLVMSIGDDWMVDLMIVYIKKTIAKALDINDLIKIFKGLSAR
jgi:hypothetical protein